MNFLILVLFRYGLVEVKDVNIYLRLGELGL